MKNHKKNLSRVTNVYLSTDKELEYKREMDSFFKNSSGTYLEKLENFAKYVPRQRIAYFLAKYEMFKKVLDVQGVIVECGVYLGGGLMTFAQLSAILEPYNRQRKIIGFDTFEGFRELSKKDLTLSKIQQKPPVYKKEKGLSISLGEFNELEKAIELFDKNRFMSHLQKVFLVKGDASKTIPLYLKKNPHTVISLLYLDFDLYRPTKTALELLLPRIPKGGIVVFDELNTEIYPGETRAVMEMVGIHNLRIQRFPFEPNVSYAVIE